MATNPLLAELANLSPGAKNALIAAHTASQNTAPPDANAGMQAPKIPQSIAHPSQDTMQPPPLQGEKEVLHHFNPPLLAPTSGAGMLSSGNMNIYNRPVVHNPDGTSSTIRSMSFGTDKGETLIPTVSDGSDGKPPHIMSNKEAIDYSRKTGQNLGTFDTPENATRFAQSLHNQQASMDEFNGRTALKPQISREEIYKPSAINAPLMGVNPQSAMHVADSVPNIEQAPKVVAAPYSKGTIEGDTAERQRLINTGSGISQIKNPFLKTLATIGDTVGSIAAPGLLAAITGTNLHHNRLLAENNRDLTTDIGNAQKEAHTGLLGAQETNQEAMPELNRMKAENAQQKQDLAETKQQQTHEHQQTQDEQTLRQHGFTRDQSGNIVPVPYEQLSPNEQAAHDLRSSQQELADANKQLREAQTANIPQQVELAKQRIATAQQNSAIAAGRLGLSQQQFGFNQEKYYNPQPTASERKTGDLAQSAVNQVKTMRSIVNAHPDIFGPAAGREQRIETWLGSQSPEAAQFKSAQTYLAEHSAGVFGARAASIVHDLKDLTSPTSNPAALHAALDQAESTAQHFVDTGKLHGKGESGQNTPTGSGKAVSLKAAMALPINKGKSAEEVRSDIQKHGHTVTE